MTKECFNQLCKQFGDPSLPDEEKWRAVKYIHSESQAGPFNDLEKLIKLNLCHYVDIPTLEPGFLIIDSNPPELSTRYTRTITFIPIGALNAVTFVSQYVDPSKNGEESKS